MNMTKTANALKHATGKRKIQYMHKYLDLAQTIAESEDKEFCACGNRMNNRPLFMVGKYNFCYDCYMAQMRIRDDILAAYNNPTWEQDADKVFGFVQAAEASDWQNEALAQEADYNDLKATERGAM
jgi:hypothetical protein